MQQSKYLLRMKDSVRGKMRVCLSDANGKCLLEQTQILQSQVEQTLHLRETLAEKVIPWSHENPYHISWRSL